MSETKRQSSVHEVVATNHASAALEDLVSFRLRLLTNLYTKASSSAYERGFGLTLNEWRIIALLASAGKLAISRLADQAQFDRGLTTRVVATLIDHGLVQKEKDLKDRRGGIASLTTKGNELVNEVTPLAVQRNIELLSCLSDQERAVFEVILSKLTEQARAMLKNERAAQAETPS